MVNFSLCIFHHKQNNKCIFLKTEKYSINLENWFKFQVQQSSLDLGKHGSIFIHFMIKQIEALRKAYASQSLGLFLYLKTHFFLFYLISYYYIEFIRVHTHCLSLLGWNAVQMHNQIRRNGPHPHFETQCTWNKEPLTLLTICWGKRRPVSAPFATLNWSVHSLQAAESWDLQPGCGFHPHMPQMKLCGSSSTSHIWE